MAEQLNAILSQRLPEFPKQVSLNMPSLKLPKLKKIEKTPKLQLPKLQKI